LAAGLDLQKVEPYFIYLCNKSVRMKRYFSEKNALTVMTGIFCFIMTIVSALQHSVWQAVAFALAFSFSVEIVCHRSKERR
jgi:hypothetical protein